MTMTPSTFRLGASWRPPQDRVMIEEMVCAFMLAKHERLGRESAVRILPIEVLQYISEAASTYRVSCQQATLPDFNSISQAVRVVPDGSTISVHDGDYVETVPIVITSRLTVHSASHAAKAAMACRLKLELGQERGEQESSDREAESVVAGLGEEANSQAVLEEKETPERGARRSWAGWEEYPSYRARCFKNKSFRGCHWRDQLLVEARPEFSELSERAGNKT